MPSVLHSQAGAESGTGRRAEASTARTAALGTRFAVGEAKSGDSQGGALAESVLPFPCLYSHICNEQVSGEVNKLAGSHRRTAYALTFEIQELAKEFGIERLGFLTLTFPRKLFDIKEAQRRFHSLNTGVLKDRYERAIGVWERHGDGGLHFHLLVVLSVDIQT